MATRAQVMALLRKEVGGALLGGARKRRVRKGGSASEMLIGGRKRKPRAGAARMMPPKDPITGKFVKAGALLGGRRRIARKPRGAALISGGCYSCPMPGMSGASGSGVYGGRPTAAALRRQAERQKVLKACEASRMADIMSEFPGHAFKRSEKAEIARECKSEMKALAARHRELKKTHAALVKGVRAKRKVLCHENLKGLSDAQLQHLNMRLEHMAA